MPEPLDLRGRNEAPIPPAPPAWERDAAVRKDPARHASQGDAGGLWARWTGEAMTWKEKVIGVIVLVLFLYVFYIVLDANKYQAQVLVADGVGKIGVNPTTERLDFGDLSRGSSSVRRVRIKNDTAIPMWIAAVEIGAIADVIKPNQNFYVLKPNTETEIEFTAYMPASAPVGQYIYGRVYLFKIPGPWK